MTNTMKILKELNTDLFNFRQLSIKHDIFVTGIRIPDPNDKTKKITVFVQKTKPNENAKKGGIKESTFIHASFKPSGTIKVDDNSDLKFSSSKKSQTDYIYQSTRPDMFNFLVQTIAEGEDKGYVQNGVVRIIDNFTDTICLSPQIELRRKIFGKIISLNVPPYTPHIRCEDGEFKPITPVIFDPLTGKYGKKPLIKSALKFFADDDELDHLEELAANIFDSRVRPWVIDKQIFLY